MCINLGFEKLVLLDTLLYGLSLILEFAALIALRVREPALARPYRVPGGLAGCILISLGPILLMAAACYAARTDPGARTGLWTAGGALALGTALYFVALKASPRLRRQLLRQRLLARRPAPARAAAADTTSPATPPRLPGVRCSL